MPAKFDVFQQTFSLSLLSNLASGYIATDRYTPGVHADPLETQLTNNIQATLPIPIVAAGLGDDWEIVWGPAVWRGKNSRVAENAAVIFYNPAVTFEDGTTAPAYVVAITATNFISSYDWIVENFTVSSTVDWTQYNPTGPVPPSPELESNTTTPLISKGTAIGVGHIAALTPTDPNHGKTSLAEFIGQLNDTASATTRIIFTGHSLAGSLAPTFALYLKEHGVLSKFAQTLTYPTAGATPGNAAFSQRFAATFAATAAGAQPWQRWNTLIHNQYDIVPCAWNPQTLAHMRTIYGNSDAAGGVKLPEQINGMIALALIDSLASKTLYTALPSVTFSPAVPEPVPATAKEYLTTAGDQHVKIYTSEILGPDFVITAHGPTVPGVIEFVDARQQIEVIIKILEKIIHLRTGT